MHFAMPSQKAGVSRWEAVMLGDEFFAHTTTTNVGAASFA